MGIYSQGGCLKAMTHPPTPSQISGRGERGFFPERHRDDVVEFFAEITQKIPLPKGMGRCCGENLPLSCFSAAKSGWLSTKTKYM